MQEEPIQLDSHSLEVLELPKTVALAAGKAQSAPGAEAVRRLELSSDPAHVERELAWTSELRSALLSSSGVPGLAFADVRPHLDKVKVEGSVLEPRQLLELAQFIHVASRAAKFFGAARAACRLSSELVEHLCPDEGLAQSIDRSIDPAGEVLDSASPTLKALRRDIERNRDKARSQLAAFLESMGPPAESFPTLRADRYMVLIPAQAKKRQKGIVHDQSASGAGIYFEPLQAVEVNNTLSRLRAAEKEEIHRILAELSSRVRSCSAELSAALAAMTKLDAVLARARMSLELSAVCPVISRDGSLRLRGARHPLLFLQGKERGFAVCPLDLEMGKDERVLLISGPNMGGKTVALKTLGLLSLMMKAGFHVPASEGTEIPVFTRVFCDIGDEQSIEEQLSTFASHMRQVATALNESDSQSLVLVDELGAGTDPIEGAALAKAVLEELEGKGCTSVATTHLGSLKSFVASSKGMRNASMAFDPVTQKPLYRLDVGVPGQSRAIETAAKMGLGERLVERARASLSTEDRQTADLLAELEALKREAQRERETLSSGTRKLAELVREYEAKLARYEEEKKELRAKAAREARALLNEARTLARTVKEELKSAAAKPGELARLKRTIEDADLVLAAEESPRRGPEPGLKPLHIEEGMKVWAQDIESVATVVSAPDHDGRVKVERKGVRIDTHVSRLGPAPREERQPGRATAAVKVSDETFSASLDLRGLMADEALESLEKYLDGAMLRGISHVTIIHGKGTGVLRKKVQEALSECSFVRNYRLGELNEGGAGVTVVELAT
ncbi:MAG: endonuclease MutS2 [Candidatus Eisenbacteria bacterium]|nr:endonuclease MutS2 [Candidatus Eisenbacteria bacterium]